MKCLLYCLAVSLLFVGSTDAAEGQWLEAHSSEVELFEFQGLEHEAADPTAAVLRARLTATAVRENSSGVGPGRIALGSSLGWVVGLAVGAAAGYLIEPDGGDGYVGPIEWWLGAWVGSSLGSAAGAHIASRRQGNLLVTSLGALVSVPLVVLITSPVIGPSAGAVAPLLQIGASVLLEHNR